MLTSLGLHCGDGKSAIPSTQGVQGTKPCAKDFPTLSLIVPQTLCTRHISYLMNEKIGWLREVMEKHNSCNY